MPGADKGLSGVLASLSEKPCEVRLADSAQPQQMEPRVKHYGRDFLDNPTAALGFEHGAERPSNRSANPTI